MYNMSTLQTVSICFTTCFMLHASALRMVLGGFGHFYTCVFEGLLDDIVIVLGAEIGNRSLV